MAIVPQFFFPEKVGRGYEPSHYIKRLGDFQNDMTVFSGVSHPGVTGGHAAERCFLTGTPHPERGGFRNWVSLDQVAAEQIGGGTRFPPLLLAMTSEGGMTPSLTRRRAAVTGESSPQKGFPKPLLPGQPHPDPGERQ